MANKITVILEDDLVEKLRIIQANLIRKSNKSVSFSKLVSDALRKGLKKG